MKEILIILLQLFSDRLKEKFLLSVIGGSFIGFFFPSHFPCLAILSFLCFFDLLMGLSHLFIDDESIDFGSSNIFLSIIKYILLFCVLMGYFYFVLINSEQFGEEHIEKLFLEIVSHSFNLNIDNTRFGFALMYGFMGFFIMGFFEFLKIIINPIFKSKQG